MLERSTRYSNASGGTRIGRDVGSLTLAKRVGTATLRNADQPFLSLTAIWRLSPARNNVDLTDAPL